jgi:biopolymer transport protein ExbB
VLVDEAEPWLERLRAGGPLMPLMLIASVLLLMIAVERSWALYWFRRHLMWVEDRLLQSTARGELQEARRLADQLPAPLREVFAIGLDRALGRERGEPGRAMRREQRRAIGDLRGLIWVLGSAGALMPFVGLLGTVLGVMGSFSAIGEAGSGGFGVVSAGISEALIATAAGLGVALEAVIFYNSLQNGVTVTGRELGLLVDEVLEHIELRGAPSAADGRAPESAEGRGPEGGGRGPVEAP